MATCVADGMRRPCLPSAKSDYARGSLQLSLSAPAHRQCRMFPGAWAAGGMGPVRCRRPCMRPTYVFQTARAGAGSGEVPGRVLSLAAARLE